MGKKKLTDKERGTIRELRSQGLSNKALADQFNVSEQTIIRICRPDLYEKNLLSNKEYREKNAQQIYSARKKAAKSYKLEFHKVNDAAIISQLDKEGNVQGYIRDLILQDIGQKE